MCASENLVAIHNNPVTVFYFSWNHYPTENMHQQRRKEIKKQTYSRMIEEKVKKIWLRQSRFVCVCVFNIMW